MHPFFFALLEEIKLATAVQSWLYIGPAGYLPGNACEGRASNFTWLLSASCIDFDRMIKVF
jgi:hypothetical protein